VQADRRISQRYGDAVLGANDVGAELVTRHLLDLGHRRIALLIDETRWTSGAGRLAGYTAAHEAAGVPVDERLIAHSTSFDALAARQATGQLLDTHPDVTAVFAANNVLAQGALEEIQRRDLAIPECLSLAAYDDVPWMSMVRPTITTVTQHTVELGRRCAQVLLERLNGGTAEGKASVLNVKPELLVRESTAPPRRDR
jgi:DNA-binding LacI/PurR family transcriptional regulator